MADLLLAEYGGFVDELDKHRDQVANDLERGRGPMGMRFS